MRFSANLGFLWADRSLPDAIRAAHAAGFDAVECHWPYDTPAADVARALRETGLPMLGLNTRRGGAGENGLAALPGREREARAAIDEAIAYAAAIDAGHVHVMGGAARGPDALATFRGNLAYACDAAAGQGIGIVIEPLNTRDAPGYVIATTDEARAVIDDLALPNLKLMFDCYHVQIMQGDLTRRLSDLLPVIGHVQFASVPDRGPPNRGEVDFAHIFAHLSALGWDRPLGAEYRPGGDTDASLGWLARFRAPRGSGAA